MLACLYIPWRNSKTTIYCNFPFQRSLAGVLVSQGESYLSPSPAACCAQPDVTRQAILMCWEYNGILLQLLTCFQSLSEFRYTHSSTQPTGKPKLTITAAKWTAKSILILPVCRVLPSRLHSSPPDTETHLYPNTGTLSLHLLAVEYGNPDLSIKLGHTPFSSVHSGTISACIYPCFAYFPPASTLDLSNLKDLRC